MVTGEPGSLAQAGTFEALSSTLVLTKPVLEIRAMHAIRRRSTGLAAALASLLASSIALAQESAPPADEGPGAAASPAFHRGVQLGARLGYAVPVGSLRSTAGGTDISNLEAASVPIGVDLGVRVSPATYLGGTVSWGAGIAPNGAEACARSNVHCAEHDVQARVEARVYFAPEKKVTGWLAAGLGWEVATYAQSIAGGYSVTSTYSGPIFPDLQLGVDWRAAGGDVLFGPYVGMTIATFMTAGIDPAKTPAPTWVSSPPLHTWLTIGFHGSYGPF
jgi:hypothetical protein